MCRLLIWGQHRPQSVQRVGLGGRLVGAPAEDAGEADGDAGLVPGRAVQMPSKASSKTSSGLTVRTGPNFSIMFGADEGVDRRISSSVRPE